MTGGCTSNHKITQHLTSQKVLDIALTVYFSLFSFFFCSYSTIQCALHLSPFSTLPPWHLTLTHQPPPYPTPTPPISKTKKNQAISTPLQLPIQFCCGSFHSCAPPNAQHMPQNRKLLRLAVYPLSLLPPPLCLRSACRPLVSFRFFALLHVIVCNNNLDDVCVTPVSLASTFR